MLRKSETPPEPDLIAEIDSTALALLRKIKGGVSVTKEQSDILTEEVRAFDAVAKWANARKDLLPKEEPKATKFAAMKGQFHDGSAASRNRRGSNSSETKGGAPSSADIVTFPGADPDDD